MYFKKAIADLKANKEQVITRGNFASQKKMADLIQAFQCNHALKKFTFNPNTVENPAQISDLLQTLEKCESLESLEVSLKNPLEEQAIKTLKKLLEEHGNIRSFTVKNTTLTDSTLPKVISSLVTNKQLTQFSCNLSNISDKTLIDTVIQLISQSTIKSLYFYPRYVTKEQMIEVVAALKNNNTLNLLCLGSDGYGLGALKIMSKYLETNTGSLSKLTLGNVSSSNDLSALADSIRNNSTLQSLNIKIPSTLECLNLAHQLMSSNGTLQSFQFNGPYAPIHDTPEWELIEDKIYKKAEQNENVTNKKRPFSEAIIKPQADLGSLPNKKQRTSQEPTDDSISNTKYRPLRIST